ncbi:MAG: hypothetical protein ACREAY_00220 [Nitrososphaera sp.]|uniref:hypothetical protein n=1 Tax=Nitrososphaera sp. TaxID=1971748 RepID=UPI003D6F908F
MANKKTIKFHGQQVHDVVVRYTQIGGASATLEEFDAAKDPEVCETINVQVVSEFVTITFYRDEKANSIVRRVLIPVHRVERMEVKDLQA